MGWTDCLSVDYPFAENPPGTKWLESASRASSHSITLLDLYRSVVDRRQHLRWIAGDDDVDHRRAVARSSIPRRNAPDNVSGSSTRMPPQPIARAIAA